MAGRGGARGRCIRPRLSNISLSLLLSLLLLLLFAFGGPDDEEEERGRRRSGGSSPARAVLNEGRIPVHAREEK